MVFLWVSLVIAVCAFILAMVGREQTMQGNERAYPEWKPNRPYWKTFIVLATAAVAFEVIGFIQVF